MVMGKCTTNKLLRNRIGFLESFWWALCCNGGLWSSGTWAAGGRGRGSVGLLGEPDEGAAGRASWVGWLAQERRSLRQAACCSQGSPDPGRAVSPGPPVRPPLVKASYSTDNKTHD